MFLTKNEDESSLHRMLTIFKSRNPAWEKVRVVVSDKDMAERAVFKSVATDLPPDLFISCA